MLYLSRLITFLYIKQEIWGLAFGDTYVSLTFTPLVVTKRIVQAEVSPAF